MENDTENITQSEWESYPVEYRKVFWITKIKEMDEMEKDLEVMEIKNRKTSKGVDELTRDLARYKSDYNEQ